MEYESSEFDQKHFQSYTSLQSVGDDFNFTDLTKYITPFDGDRNKLPLFITNCENALNLANSLQYDILLQYIISQLQGQAKFACSLRTFEKWSELKQFLELLFGGTKPRHDQPAELKNGIQKPTETAPQDKLRLDTTLTVGKTDVTQTSRDPGEVKPGNTNSTSEELSPQSPKPQEFKPKCKLCGNIGHTDVTCPTSRQRLTQTFNNQPLQQFSSFGAQTNRIICGYCKYPGHDIPHCTRRQFNLSSKNYIPNQYQIPAHNMAEMSLKSPMATKTNVFSGWSNPFKSSSTSAWNSSSKYSSTKSPTSDTSATWIAKSIKPVNSTTPWNIVTKDTNKNTNSTKSNSWNSFSKDTNSKSTSSSSWNSSKDTSKATTSKSNESTWTSTKNSSSTKSATPTKSNSSLWESSAKSSTPTKSSSNPWQSSAKSPTSTKSSGFGGTSKTAVGTKYK